VEIVIGGMVLEENYCEIMYGGELLTVVARFLVKIK
jgi:hypothetical protein